MKVLAEGAEAVVYETEVGGIPALLKRRIRKEYRMAAMDTRIRTRRSRNEARLMATVAKAGINAPRLILFDGYDIYMTAITGRKLLEMIGAGGAPAGLFERIGAMLGRLHNMGIAHGDYTPANIIVGKNGPYIIDFGLSEASHSVEEQALDLLLMKRSVSRSSYGSFLKGYSKESSNAAGVLQRLKSIERRGRYQTRTLA